MQSNNDLLIYNSIKINLLNNGEKGDHYGIYFSNTGKVKKNLI